MANNELTAHDAVSILRGALVQAECAIKGREHTGFITRALVATEHVAAPAQGGLSDALPELPPLPEDAAGAWERVTGQIDVNGMTGDVIECDEAYSAEQVHTYATAYAKQAIEACGGALSDAEISDLADDHDCGRNAKGNRLFSDRNLLAFVRAIEARILGQQGGGDAARLDWLDKQSVAYGFENMHEGNRWMIDGPFSTLRRAIDSGMRYDAAIQAQAGDAPAGGDRG